MTAAAPMRMMKSAEYAAQLGDPAKVASVILEVAALEQPPLRLRIGSRTMEYAHSFDQAISALRARLCGLRTTTSEVSWLLVDVGVRRVDSITASRISSGIGSDFPAT